MRSRLASGIPGLRQPSLSATPRTRGCAASPPRAFCPKGKSSCDSQRRAARGPAAGGARASGGRRAGQRRAVRGNGGGRRRPPQSPGLVAIPTNSPMGPWLVSRLSHELPEPSLTATRLGSGCTVLQASLHFHQLFHCMEILTSGIRRTAGARARLPAILPALSGARLNGAELGRLLGVSRPTAMAYLCSLEEVGLVTRVAFYAGGGRSGGRRPLLVSWHDVSPRAELLRSLRALRADCRFYWWARRTREVDLVVDLGDERVGFCFSSTERPVRRDWEPLALAIDREIIDRGFVLHAGDHASRRPDRPIFCIPRCTFMRQPEDWVVTWRDPRESWQAMYRANRAAAPRAPGFP